MLIVQLYDLLILYLNYIPDTTQKTMVTMATNFNSHQGLEMSLTPYLSHDLALSSGIILIIFAKAHDIIILKLLQKLQPPISIP
jgi:hypothetical protein